MATIELVFHAVNYILLVAIGAPTVLVALPVLTVALLIHMITKRRGQLKDKSNRLERRGHRAESIEGMCA